MTEPPQTEDPKHASDSQTAYLYGASSLASHGYHVGYYDGDGNIVQSDGVTSGAGSTLSSECHFLSHPTAAIGTWHAVVFDDSQGSPPATYAACSTACGYVVEDDFVVAEGAVPEFSTVMAAIGVAGFCFGIYYLMRRRARFKMQNVPLGRENA